MSTHNMEIDLGQSAEQIKQELSTKRPWPKCTVNIMVYSSGEVSDESMAAFAEGMRDIIDSGFNCPYALDVSNVECGWDLIEPMMASEKWATAQAVSSLTVGGSQIRDIAFFREAITARKRLDYLEVKPGGDIPYFQIVRAALLRGKAASLHRLSVGGVDAEFTDEIVKLIGEDYNIRILELTGESIPADKCLEIVCALETNTHLVSLSMPNTQGTDWISVHNDTVREKLLKNRVIQHIECARKDLGNSGSPINVRVQSNRIANIAVGLLKKENPHVNITHDVDSVLIPAFVQFFMGQHKLFYTSGEDAASITAGLRVNLSYGELADLVEAYANKFPYPKTDRLSKPILDLMRVMDGISLSNPKSRDRKRPADSLENPAQSKAARVC